MSRRGTETSEISQYWDESSSVELSRRVRAARSAFYLTVLHAVLVKLSQHRKTARSLSLAAAPCSLFLSLRPAHDVKNT